MILLADRDCPGQTRLCRRFWLITGRNMMRKARTGPLRHLRTTRAQISLCICTGWSGPSLSAYNINRYCSICQRTENAQIRLQGCARSSGPLLFAFGISAFVHAMHRIVFYLQMTRLEQFHYGQENVWRARWFHGIRTFKYSQENRKVEPDRLQGLRPPDGVCRKYGLGVCCRWKSYVERWTKPNRRKSVLCDGRYSN